MKLGIIGAMDLEVGTLKSSMTQVKTLKKAGMEFWEGNLRGLPAVVVQCGVGKVNAGICAQILADLFGVTAIVNTGIAGSLDKELDIGDILISTDAMYHDFDCHYFDYTPGQVPGLPLAFPADDALAKQAEAACRAMGISFRRGRVASGDQFVSGKALKERIISITSASCTEMEGAAIAQAAYRNGIPFLILRAISDKADDSAQMDYPTFERQAAEHCAGLVLRLAAALA